ncbi:amidase [Cohnella lubricantis]|uniref:Amidase n=1 Tax=Cohnella lubricantis TaxID=2163172 RepID=A0A841TA57_9BACL|nr:amidase [Cohnella lubricantis]MBB6678184.1 amidase [Cohnella lubricantis]MBP2119689.1 amidase/aspartyl-tRNA(Asn)/glutamyl-tRNA(Gln) amidotransferase subunit A [Cohnella lubricantis]
MRIQGSALFKRRRLSLITALLLAITLLLPYIPASTAAAAQAFAYEEITLEELQDGYADGKFTTVQVVQAYLDRIQLYEPNYNAFTTMNANVLKEAAEIDRARAAGEELGPLAGIPIVIKEAVDMAGYPSTMGWAPLSPEKGGIRLIPEKDAPVVARLKAAGAVIIGRTNIPAFSSSGTRATTSWDGDTYNAVDRRFVPGGSSSGTAMSVSGNFAVLGIAEETGGSIQNPAAAQNIVGIKPTFGLVPNAGVVPLGGSTRDVIGTHARTVHDAAAMLDVIAGYTHEDPKTVASIGNMPANGYTSKLNTQALQGKRIGLYGKGWRDQDLTPETQQLYDRAIQELVAQGATVITDPFADTDFAATVKSADGGIGSVYYDMQDYLERLGPSAAINNVQELIEMTGEVPSVFTRYDGNLPDPNSEPDLSAFIASRTDILKIFNDVMDKYDLDALVYPQMFKETPLLSSEDNIGATTVSEINLAGVPLVTVPAGYYKSGSPFELAFTGKMWSEADLLGMAYDYEQATAYRKAPVLLEKE